MSELIHHLVSVNLLMSFLGVHLIYSSHEIIQLTFAVWSEVLRSTTRLRLNLKVIESSWLAKK